MEHIKQSYDLLNKTQAMAVELICKLYEGKTDKIVLDLKNSEGPDFELAMSTRPKKKKTVVRKKKKKKVTKKK